MQKEKQEIQFYLSTVWPHFYVKSNKKHFLWAFKPKMVPSDHVLDNVCACHKLPWFTMHLPTHLLHASGQAWHLNIQGLYKRIREWDHNCFVTLSVGKSTECNVSLSVLLIMITKKQMYSCGQFRSINCILDKWRTC